MTKTLSFNLLLVIIQYFGYHRYFSNNLSIVHLWSSPWTYRVTLKDNESNERWLVRNVISDDDWLLIRNDTHLILPPFCLFSSVFFLRVMSFKYQYWLVNLLINFPHLSDVGYNKQGMCIVCIYLFFIVLYTSFEMIQ